MANAYDLRGRQAIVTGGANGIGRAIVERFVESGAKVRVWDAVEATTTGATADVVDVTRPDALQAALARMPATTRIDILVNCAGYLGTAEPFDGHAASDWRRIIDINLVGTLLVTQAVLPHMIAAGGGRIVNLGSLAGKEGLAGLAAYSAASAGVIAFTKALGRELAAHKVFVNCIAPGPIDTRMIRGLGDATVARMIGASPMQRLGSADEVAHLAAWLCSDASRFNTGAVFDMSGGRATY